MVVGQIFSLKTQRFLSVLNFLEDLMHLSSTEMEAVSVAVLAFPCLEM